MENSLIITYLTIFNSGYIDFAINNILNYINIMKSETSKLLMVALDVESHNTVNKFLKENVNTVDNKSIEILLDDISYHNFYEFNSNGFIKMMHKKLKIIHEKLLNSEILHYFDSDVVFLKNPEDVIKQEILEHDVVFQQDAPVADHNNKYHNYVCAGNFSIKNTTNSLKFISEIINRLSDHKNDQEVLYEYLNSQVSNITNTNTVNYMHTIKHYFRMGVTHSNMVGIQMKTLSAFMLII